MLAGIKAIVARFNAISHGLSLAPSKQAPLFEKTGNGLAFPQPWWMGFLQRDAAACRPLAAAT